MQIDLKICHRANPVIQQQLLMKSSLKTQLRKLEMWFFYLENFLYGPLGKRREKNLLATWRTSQIRVRRAKSSSAQEDGLTCLSLWIFSMCPDNLVVCWSQFPKWRAQAWMCCPPGHTESVVKGVVREQIIPTCSCTAQTCPHLDMMLNQVLPKPSIQSLYNFFFK